ncbi:50S ribosomal protein L30 [Sinanaerobacter sp. ZZT-01]|uniref:50S ribosomal protein L30 n=1 Tax=Sinanaerobacter sp. ZZT-01 TaxID=3111540 RepID=UPI002D78256D|nr:50S ribosomal protein L30 [Sinanaerobacter sp. ZZT-01]WRR92048.1 50S ribosomal protein L30 [Sinanaerobacter sp. ZZT-01]
MANKTVKITLIKSVIGASPAQRKVVEALGLRKIRHTVELPDTPQTRGAVAKVSHLLKVED